MSDSSLWNCLQPGTEVTIVKTHFTPHRPDYSYPAVVIESDRHGWIAFEAYWALPDMNVDGIRYEKNGMLIEYFSPEQNFNIFHVLRRDGESSGMYANVTQLPTLVRNEQDQLVLTWIDCWLDVIRLPSGEVKLLDEEELDASRLGEDNPELAEQIRSTAQSVIALLSSEEWDG